MNQKGIILCGLQTSSPTTCLQLYHMIASLTILVNPLANMPYFVNHVLVKISYCCKPACEPALAPMQKHALASIRFAISSARTLTHHWNDRMTPLCYSNVG